jgi:hypothetical protein
MYWLKREYQGCGPSRALARATETEYEEERRRERRYEGRRTMKLGLSYLEKNLAALRLDVRRLERVLSSAPDRSTSC